MDLFEYQARDMFEKHGVPVLAGAIATTPEQARAAAEEIGPKSGGVTVVKAQVKTGGRGKAGGVKVAKTADEAQQHAEAILGMDIKGHTVGTVMIAQGAQIAEEYYFSILLDRANRTYLAMCSKEGGMDIEQLAVERPEALARIEVDPNTGIDEAKAAGDRRPRPASTTRPAPRSSRSCRPCGPSTATRTPRWSRSTRWSRPRTATSSPWTAR